MKKKLTFQEQQKREKAKKIVKWVAVGLGWTSLFVCFVLLLAVGVKGCKKQNNKTAEVVALGPLKKHNLLTNDFLNYYVLDYTQSSASIYTSVQNEICEAFNVPTQNYASNQESIFATEDVNDLYASLNGFYVPVNSFTIKFSTYGNTIPVYRYMIEFVSVNIQDINYNIINKSQTTSDDYVYAVTRIAGNGMALNFYGDMSDDTTSFLLNWLYHKGEATKIHFNNQINFNAPYYASFEQLFVIDNEFTDNFSVFKNYDFDIGFISNGRLFTRIKVSYQQGNGTRYLDGDEIKTNNTVSSGHYGLMMYENTDTGESVVVNMRDFQFNNGGTTYMLPTSHWISELYQDIYILDEDQPLITKVTGFNNNINGINGGVNSLGGSSNIFDLLRSAFGSVIDILNITIIPGITIGLLVFMPIVVTLVVLVFKAVKK